MSVGPNQNKPAIKKNCHLFLKKANRLDGLVRTLALYGVLERNAIDSSK